MAPGLTTNGCSSVSQSLQHKERTRREYYFAALLLFEWFARARGEFNVLLVLAEPKVFVPLAVNQSLDDHLSNQRLGDLEYGIEEFNRAAALPLEASLRQVDAACCLLGNLVLWQFQRGLWHGLGLRAAHAIVPLRSVVGRQPYKA